MFELASILILGIFAQWLAWKTKVPAILPLIIIGLLVGPLSTYITPNGHKWIEPMYKEDIHHGIFPGQILFYFVTLSIGVILFEGGLTLKLKELKGVGSSIGKLVSMGAFITFILSSVLTYYILGLSWSMSFLFGGLIIVTGPTVIQPILRNLTVKKDIGTLLKWEGILIDPIGALVAILVFEFIVTGAHQSFIKEHVFQTFGQIILIGVSVGFTSAYALSFAIKRKMIPHYLLNVVTLALVLAVFVSSDVLVEESGLLAVVVMGMVLGNIDLPDLKGILYFKESLSVILISMLFILLSANIEIEQLELLLDWKILVLFLAIILLVRPIAVFLSTWGSEFDRNDKLFISWMGPRGIVAAGIASLFGMKLTQLGVEGAEMITPLVFMVVLGTVLLNATTAGYVGGKLGVLLGKSKGILIVGSTNVARLIGKYLEENGRHVVLVDSNKNNIERAQKMGLQAIQADVYSDDLFDNPEFNDVGITLAMTGSSDVNKYVVEKYGEHFGENGVYRLVSPKERENPEDNPSTGLFSHTDDYINLSEVGRDYPYMREIVIESEEHFRKLIKSINIVQKSIPLFLKRKSGDIEIIGSFNEDMKIEPGDIIVYIGKECILNESKV